MIASLVIIAYFLHREKLRIKSAKTIGKEAESGESKESGSSPKPTVVVANPIRVDMLMNERRLTMTVSYDNPRIFPSMNESFNYQDNKLRSSIV